MVKISAKNMKVKTKHSPMKKGKKTKPKNSAATTMKKKRALPKKLKINKEEIPDEEEDLSDEELIDEAEVMNEDSDLDQDDIENESNDDSENEDEMTSHKESLQKLMQTDPDFYQFLQENDKKLLNFGVSDSEEDSDDEAEKGEEVHKPADELEVASDESDFEAEDDEEQGEKIETDKRQITLKMLKTWQSDLQTDKSNKTIGCLIKAFNAAIMRVASEEDVVQSHYKVDGSAVFNAVIQVCVLELGPAVRRFLGLNRNTKHQPHKCKRFTKLKTLIKGYFNDLLKLLHGVSSSNILTVVLKHLHYMAPLLTSYLTITKPLLKKLVKLWGSASDETVRVVSFLCILRITHGQQQALLDTTLKTMYMTYVQNSKFMSMSTLPAINFMRRSLVEMFALDLNVSYQHVFLYVRQLAIHLRNAITVKKKENIQVVYNWQFVNSLRLWGNLLAATCNKPPLQPLVYPFVQICLGTLKLLPTTQYYPLRFHITQILIDLSRDVGVFIPVMPFLLEVLSSYDFNKKHQKASMKPIQFTCILRVSKSQLVENGFKDTTIDHIYGQLLEYLANQSHSIAFPDLSFTPRVQLKQFVKKCSISNYTRKMRQLHDKIDQNSQFIENERKKATFTLSEFKLIEAWETTVQNKGTPMKTFFDDWDKVRTIKKGKQATGSEALGDYNLPELKKTKKKKVKESGEGTSKEVVLFPSDDDSDDYDKDGDAEKIEGGNSKTGKKTTRGARGGKKQKKAAVKVEGFDEKEGDPKDIVEDIDASGW